MTREQAYTEQMKLLGIYQPIFDPEIRTLCKLERDLQRLEKRWKEAGCPTVERGGRGPTTSDKTLDAIMAMRREVLAHRDALGLTPKGLSRLKGKGTEPAAAAPASREPTTLDLIRGQAKRRTG